VIRIFDAIFWPGRGSSGELESLIPRNKDAQLVMWGTGEDHKRAYVLLVYPQRLKYWKQFIRIDHCG